MANQMSASLYEDDLLAWAEAQAEALRVLACRPELSNLVDWDNVIEEIETLGRSDFRAVQSFLTLGFIHLIKLASDPMHNPARHWEGEIQNFMSTFQKLCTETIARKLDCDDLWAEASRRASHELWAFGGKLLPGLPETCPFSIAFLRAKPFDTVRALEHITEKLANRGGMTRN
jgi:Domain of unknown function DUF29